MSLRVVLADDSVTMQGRILDALKGIVGVEIVARCENGKEALDAIRALQPDIAILDNIMPHLTGAEVVDAMRAENLPTKAMLCTSVAQGCVVDKYTVLIKPFNKTQMTQKIWDLFGTVDFTEATNA